MSHILATVSGALAGCLSDSRQEQKAAKVGAILKVLDHFDWNTYHRNVRGELGDAFGLVVTTQGRRAAERAGGDFRPDDPFMQERLTGYVGDRIVELDETTKNEVATLIRGVLDEAEGLTTGELGDKIAELVQEKFDGYADWRADRIARTETSIAYNYGNAFGYMQSGVTHVLISDGDDDEDCRKVDGTVQTIEWFLANPIAHPNCERDGAPVLDDEKQYDERIIPADPLMRLRVLDRNGNPL